MGRKSSVSDDVEDAGQRIPKRTARSSTSPKLQHQKPILKEPVPEVENKDPDDTDQEHTRENSVHRE